jgi:hypothetical protein
VALVSERTTQTERGSRLSAKFCQILFLLGQVVCPKPHHPRWRTTPCRLSAVAYSMYSHIRSIAGSRPSILNLRTRHAVVTRDSSNIAMPVLSYNNINEMIKLRLRHSGLLTTHFLKTILIMKIQFPLCINVGHTLQIYSFTSTKTRVPVSLSRMVTCFPTDVGLITRFCLRQC